ncbi:MAG: hypothetical protein NZ908_00395, partial [Candidatus Micrarchaeota archaeon]|nr:hypothetical protein [Candidatus Micrarchaeota archaeon]
MKKMSAKKIGAVLGAALVASSAFGAVSFENTELVSNNGQVVAKVVVGSKAQPSDGVAAAKIASYLASRAFSKRQVSAELEGQAVCRITNGTSDARCEVVNKSVDLTIIMPGLRSRQVVQLNPLIGETLDTELGDRDAPGSSDSLNVLTKLWDDFAHPDQNQVGSSGLFGISSSSPYDAFVIDYRNFDGFKIHTVAGRGIQNVQEKERVYVKGETYYDDGQVKFRLRDLIYSAVFGPDNSGLPLCPGDVQKDYNSCEPSKRIEASRAQIKFMGQNWYITKVDIPVQSSGAPTQSQQIYTVSGAEIHLAKESTYGIINVGESLSTEDGQLRVVLDDINKNDIQNNPAIISVVDRNNNTLVQDQIRPGETKTLQLGGGRTIKVHVYQTAPGTVLLAKWAELAILKDSIVLRHGDEFLDDQNTVYSVGIGFTHRRASSSLSPFTATHLKEIVVYATGLNEAMKKGDKYHLTDVQGYKVFELTYDGLTNPSMNNINLRYSTSSITGTLADGNLYSFDVTEYVEVQLGQPVRVTARAGGGNNNPDTTFETKTLYFVTANLPSSTVKVGDLLVRDSGRWYYVDNPGTITLDYRPAGNIYGKLLFNTS